jgi:hypothetical protein
MYRIGTTKRYTEFLNELVNINTEMGQIEGPNNIAKERYGISGSFFSFLVHHREMFKEIRKGIYTTDRRISFDEGEVGMIISDFNLYKYNKKHNLAEKINTTDSKSALAEYTALQLIAELKHRGYSGSLKIQKEIKF